MLLESHQQLEDLFVATAPAPQGESTRLEINITFDTGWTARMAGCANWQVELPGESDEWLHRLDQLRRWDHKPITTDEQGGVQGEAAEARVALRKLTQWVGARLTAWTLSDEARSTISDAVRAAKAREPVWLAIRVEAPDELELQNQADRLLALPWELLCFDNVFPVEQGTLDVTREAVQAELEGTTEPTKPLSVVATVAAPVDCTTLDHETESYRLWKAMGSREQALYFTDLGTVDSFIDAVQRYKPPVVHFTGHGLPGHLLFEDLAAEGDKVEVATVVRRLREAGFPQLIYLANCYGASPDEQTFATSRKSTDRDKDRTLPIANDQAPDQRMTDPTVFEKPPQTSTAAALHRAGLSQVVAYFGPVGDEQSTRAEAEFYANLALGKTARQAVRAARIKSAEPVRLDGVPRYIYPLGWAQLALYHRGEDVPTTLPIALGEQLPSMLDESRQRRIMRLNPSNDQRNAAGMATPRGVERLEFGFIGRRRSRSELYRRWKQGERLIVVQGLGGLGKTTLCTEMLPILARMAGMGDSILALDGRAAGEADDCRS